MNINKYVFQLLDMEKEIKKDFKTVYVCGKNGPSKTILINNLKIHSNKNISNNILVFNHLFEIPLDGEFPDYIFVDKLTFDYMYENMFNFTKLTNTTDLDNLYNQHSDYQFQYIVFDYTKEAKQPENIIDELNYEDITIEI